MKIYYIVNSKGFVRGSYVFLSEERAKRELYFLFPNDPNMGFIKEAEVPFIGKYVSFVNLYRGFEYGMYDMYDDITEIGPFPSKELAQQSNLWKTFEQVAKAEPDKHSFYPDKICSKDWFGDDFYFGDVMEGGFNMKLLRLRVNKLP